MKFGLAHVPRWGFRASLEIVSEAEQSGYDSAWIADQPFYLDPFALLGAAATQTSRIRLGVGVTNPLTLHPVIIARLAATLADATSGRFILGLGTGNKREFLKPLGQPTDGGPERCLAAVEVIRRLWAGEETRVHSDLVVADGVRLSFPAQPAPVFVAGVAPRILNVAGAVADGVIVNSASPSGITHALEHVYGAQRLPALGPPEVVAWIYTLISDDPAQAYDRLRPMIAHTVAPTARATLDAAGLSPIEMDSIKRGYQTEGPEAAARYVSDKTIDQWAWCGPAAPLVEKCQALEESGVTSVCIIPWSRDLDETRRIGRSFAEAVLNRIGRRGNR